MNGSFSVCELFNIHYKLQTTNYKLFDSYSDRLKILAFLKILLS